MRKSRPRLPDPADSSQDAKLKALVANWVARRDVRQMRAGLVALALKAQSNYVTVMLDGNASNADFRRYGRYLSQCDRLASAVSQSVSAKTLHMVADFPPVRPTVDVLKSGLGYFRSDAAKHFKLEGLDAIVAFAKQVVLSQGLSISLEITDQSGTSTLMGVTRTLQTGEQPAYLLLLSTIPNVPHSVELVGQLLELNDNEVEQQRRVMTLVGDFREDDPDIHILHFNQSPFEALTKWCIGTGQTELDARSHYARFERGRFGDPATETINDPTSERRLREIFAGAPEGAWASYVALPFRGMALVGFFDLLGFSTYLERQWTALREPETVLKRLRDNLADSGAKVINLASSLAPPSFPEIRTMSDSIIAFTPTTPGTAQVFSALATIVDLTNRLQHLAAELGFGLRGALELGEIYCDSVDITGPALAAAVRLEHHAAASMRTILGPRLLEDLAAQMEDGQEHSRPASILDYIRPSNDGLWRARYANVGRTIQELHASAPDEAKSKYAEFISVFDGRWVDVGWVYKNELPLNQALLSAARLTRAAETKKTKSS